MHMQSEAYFKFVAVWAGEKVVAGTRNLVHRRVEAGQAGDLHGMGSTCRLRARASRRRTAHQISQADSSPQWTATPTAHMTKAGADLQCRSHLQAGTGPYRLIQVSGQVGIDRVE